MFIQSSQKREKSNSLLILWFTFPMCSICLGMTIWGFLKSWCIPKKPWISILKCLRTEGFGGTFILGNLHTYTHTLDKNGSLYDPAGTESWNMQIRDETTKLTRMETNRHAGSWLSRLPWTKMKIVAGTQIGVPICITRSNGCLRW